MSSTSDQDQNKVLRIDLDNDCRIKNEEPKDFNYSFFSETYGEALQMVGEIVRTNKAVQPEKGKEDPCMPVPNQEYNNIIAFIGSRGSGKSSTIRSFARALTKQNNDTFFDPEPELQKAHFNCMEVIEPNLFEQNEDIFELVLAKMFLTFKEKIEDSKCDKSEEERFKVLKAFKKVYESLQTIKKDPKERYRGELLETLDKMALSSSLKKFFTELIKQYLNFVCDKEHGPSSEKEEYLVIVIDDFDIGIKNAPQICEQLRKYLVSPNLIVLIAVEMNQLTDMLEENYMNTFKMKTNKGISYNAGDPLVKSILYVNKIFPLERRIFLPDIKNKFKTYSIKITSTEGEWIDWADTVEKGVLKMFYCATGLEFLAKEQVASFMVPNTLRKLHDFLKYLIKYAQINVLTKTKIEVGDQYKGFKAFETYFFAYFLGGSIKDIYGDLLQDFVYVDTRNRNKFMARSVYASYKSNLKQIKISEVFDENEPEYDMVENVLNRFNTSPNISLGDAVFILNKVYNYIQNKPMKNFILSCKVLYTIKLNELLFYPKQKTDEELIYLFGGAVYHPESQLLCGETQKKRKARFFYKYNEVWDRLEKNGNCPDSIKITTIIWLHFFTISFGKLSHDYRVEKVPYYKKSNLLSNDQVHEFAVFDVFAFLSTPFDTDRIYYTIRNLTIEDKWVSKKDFVKEWKKWKIKLDDWKKVHKIALPVYSVDYLESLLESLELNDLKLSEEVTEPDEDTEPENVQEELYFDYFCKFFKEIYKHLKKVARNHAYLAIKHVNNLESNPIQEYNEGESHESGIKTLKDEWVAAFIHCPLIKPLLKPESDEEKSLKKCIEKLLNDIYKDADKRVIVEKQPKPEEKGSKPSGKEEGNQA